MSQTTTPSGAAVLAAMDAAIRDLAIYCPSADDEASNELLHARAVLVSLIASLDSNVKNVHRLMNGLYAIYAELERVAPWSQSNDMDDIDEIMCAIGLLAQHRDALIARNAELEAERDAYKTMWQQAEEDVSKLAADNLALREVVEATFKACDLYLITNTGDEDAVGVLFESAQSALARKPAKENDDG